LVKAGNSLAIQEKVIHESALRYFPRTRSPMINGIVLNESDIFDKVAVSNMFYFPKHMGYIIQFEQHVSG
jgi:hypothetical protein